MLSSDHIHPSSKFFGFFCLFFRYWRSYHNISLPELIKKFLSSISTKKHNHDLLTHCKQEVIHAVWRILLDDDFVKAYKNGIIVTCFDGTTRRVYSRIFIYSADYLEKLVSLACMLSRYWTVWRVILATIWDKGHCPCPCCLMPKRMFCHTRLIRDLATRLSHAQTYLIDKLTLTHQAIYMLSRPLKVQL